MTVTNEQIALVTHSNFVQQYQNWNDYIGKYFEPVKQRLEAEKRYWQGVRVYKGMPVTPDKIKFFFKYSTWGMEDDDQDKDPSVWIDIHELIDLEAYEAETARLVAERESKAAEERANAAAVQKEYQYKHYLDLKAIFEPE